MAQKELKSQLPHNYRIINATLVAVLTAFLAINLSPHLPGDFLAFERAKIVAMFNPTNLSSHLLLAQEYLKRGDMDAVTRELTLAQDLTAEQPQASTSVLGTTLSPLKILQKIESQPQTIREEIVYWEKVVAEKPSYRDAYLQLAILNYQIYKNQQAKEYLNKALELDPNFSPTKQLERIIY